MAILDINDIGSGDVSGTPNSGFGRFYYRTGTFHVKNESGTDIIITAGGAASKVVQIVNTSTGAVSTTTTAIPGDDTIPQISEGGQILSRAITPQSSSNILKIDVTVVISHSVTGNDNCVALFQDATANALACAAKDEIQAGYINTVTFSYYMTAGTTASTTFTVRGGGHTGATMTFNGNTGVRRYGGVLASSITITEFAP